MGIESDIGIELNIGDIGIPLAVNDDEEMPQKSLLKLKRLLALTLSVLRILWGTYHQIGSNHSNDVVTTPFLRSYGLAFNTVQHYLQTHHL